MLALVCGEGKPKGVYRLLKMQDLVAKPIQGISIGAHPRYETVNAVLQALGVKFAVATVYGS